MRLRSLTITARWWTAYALARRSYKRAAARRIATDAVLKLLL